ncbi:MAG: hypothetical protein RL338_1289 [Chloroflexota bacterium]|jgi:predicted 3-demethylubiquinone-9 3-methyltransferase (glyoxalase superfamily)
MPTLNPCLFFDKRALEAAERYAAVFGGTVDSIARAEADTPFMKRGDVMSVEFTILGQRFVAIDGGAQFPFSEAISFQVHCADQAEVDRYWAALLADGGEESMCGWLKDRFGVSWQVIPRQLGEYLGGPDREGARRATEAMLTMRRLDVDALRRAYEGG